MQILTAKDMDQIEMDEEVTIHESAMAELSILHDAVRNNSCQSSKMSCKIVKWMLFKMLL